ncbi:centrosome and spindle pole-associated protein 1-like isoform X2 [Hyperolius riggenbachi]|uniref:centrosome and spindle pole-associated protein 1-like isoform X2 n=1 Tax=Hyperolius riggenbachi TaxID=752182 RepID=UPI0035A2631D
MSFPNEERLSPKANKERLRFERHSEYNQFLKLKTDEEEERLKLAQVASKEYTDLMGPGEEEQDTHGMSLPIGDRLSPKERLRNERNCEYNQFLQLKTEGEEERHRLAQAVSDEYDQKEQNRVKLEQYSATQMSLRDQDFSRKDAYTFMEAFNQPARPVRYNVASERDSKQRAGAEEGASLGSFPEEKPRQNRQAAQSYQEELERQIRGNTEKRRQDKEERDRYDAKLEAEMKDYNPWGKGGGGAPLTDAKGKPVTHLQRMHKQNEDAYQNAEDQRAMVGLERSLAESKIGGSASQNPPRFGRTSMFTEPRSEKKVQQVSYNEFARSSMFTEPRSEKKLQQEESYKDFLRQQIEEKKCKAAEERELNRLEDEREAKHVAGQRSNIQQEYEEEENKKKLQEEEEEDILKM